MKRRKRVKMSYISFWVRWLAEHAPKTAMRQFNKLAGRNVRNPREAAKIISKLLLLSQRRVLMKNQRALSNTENGPN